MHKIDNDKEGTVVPSFLWSLVRCTCNADTLIIECRFSAVGTAAWIFFPNTNAFSVEDFSAHAATELVVCLLDGPICGYVR